MGISILAGNPQPVGLGGATPTDVVMASAVGAANLAAREDHTHKIVDTGWITATMLNGWLQYHADWGPAQYRKVGPMVFLRGLIRSGTLGAVAFYLPAGYRPPYNSLFAVMRDPNVDGRVDVFPDGAVIMAVAAQGWTSLNEVAFVAV